MNNDTKFIITTPCYNCVKYVHMCLNSICLQTYKNYEMFIVDDGSTDGTYEKIKQWIADKNDDRFHLIRNEINEGSSVGSNVKAIDYSNAGKEDVIVNIDGDDWLPDSKVFEHLNNLYKTKDIWMTYGQFTPASKSYKNICAKVPDTKTYRKSMIWLKRMYASHLRTFKKKAFDCINRDHFRDFEDKNKFLQSAGDISLIFPLLEICGNERAIFVNRIMYVYNDQNDISIMYRTPEKQIQNAKWVSEMDVYEERESL